MAQHADYYMRMQCSQEWLLNSDFKVCIFLTSHLSNTTFAMAFPFANGAFFSLH